MQCLKGNVVIGGGFRCVMSAVVVVKRIWGSVLGEAFIGYEQSQVYLQGLTGESKLLRIMHLEHFYLT